MSNAPSPVSEAAMEKLLNALLRTDPGSAPSEVIPQEASVETLQRMTGLARGTVHNAIKRLESMLESRPHRDSAMRGRRGGKATTYYRLAKDVGRALVLDFNHDRVTAWMSDSFGNVRVMGERRLDVDGEAQSAIKAGAELLLGLPAKSWQNVIGIALSIPAPVDPERQVTLGHVLPKWEDDIDDLDGTLCEYLHERLAERKVQILIDNDANLASLAEYRTLEPKYGVDQGFPNRKLSNLVLVKLVPGRIGVGAGAVIDGKQLRGAGFAMELGHLPLDTPISGGANEVKCPHCGRTNCLQARISTDALIGGDPPPTWDDAVKWTRNRLVAFRSLRRSAVEANDYAKVERLDASRRNLATEDPQTRAIIVAGEEMGRALAKVVTLLDPDVIALEGELARAWLDTGTASLRDVVGTPLKDTFEACFPWSLEHAVSPILASPGGNCARGAATAVLNQCLKSSILERVKSQE
jgi:predicted NBD/HSP70 family sugar kinase